MRSSLACPFLIDNSTVSAASSARDSEESADSSLDLFHSPPKAKPKKTTPLTPPLADVEVEAFLRFLNIVVNLPDGVTLVGTAEGLVSQFHMYLCGRDKRLLKNVSRRLNSGGCVLDGLVNLLSRLYVLL